MTGYIIAGLYLIISPRQSQYVCARHIYLFGFQLFFTITKNPLLSALPVILEIS